MTNTQSDTATGSVPQPPKNRPWRRSFWCLFATQFQGAFSDNVYKFIVIYLITGLAISQEQRDTLVPLVGAIFSIPFVIFSMSGGFLADRFSKRHVIIGTKISEIIIMSLALTGLLLGYLPMLIGVVFLMSSQSAFFGPSKYGSLPEILPENRLSWGNGLLSLGTFVAIILGTLVAGLLSDNFGERPHVSGMILIGLAIIGFSTSLGVRKLPPANQNRRFQVNIFSEVGSQVKRILQDRVLYLAIAGCNYFWFLGALLQFTILIYGKDVLLLNDTQSSILQASLAIGIGFGSFAAGYLSGRKIEYGLVPLGSLGLTVFSLIFYFPGLSFIQTFILLGLLGFSAGFFIVPVNALIQQRPEKHEKGTIIATSSFLNSICIFLATGVYFLFSSVFKFSSQDIFLVASLMTLAGTIYVVWLLPDSLIRLLFWMLTHTIYRIKVMGRDNIPGRGGALFVCNHLSMVDAMLLQASTERPIRILMYEGKYNVPWIRPLARIMKVIPISSEQNPRKLIQSLKTAREAIENGEVVCIFAEGQMTRIGQMMPFRRGFEKIMKGLEAPIIPIGLDGIWGSIFSYNKGRYLWKWPRYLPYPVTVNFGRPLPANTPPLQVRQSVQELVAVAWKGRRQRMEPVQRGFIRTARVHPFRFAAADRNSGNITFGNALVRSVFIAGRLKKTLSGEKADAMTGILLPPSIPASLVNHALFLKGKIPVNLNYTLSHEALDSCIRQCHIETVLTSRLFIKKLRIPEKKEFVYLEDIVKKPGKLEMIWAWVKGVWLPPRLLERSLGMKHEVQLDDTATVIFSSGSTGDPKGVELSHYNIISNVEQMGQIFDLQGSDCFLGILPFFHSFGFTGTLVLPALLGVGAVYHNNPLDGKAIGELVSKHKVSFLLATPTFLQFYMRHCTREQFASLKTVMVGAEKLPERVASSFEKKFGIPPLEAYGCTECSPGVAVNTGDFVTDEVNQTGNKPGTIGHPLPGIGIQIRHPDSGAAVPHGESGLLWVRGPNIMKGYLGKPDLTGEVLIKGWYCTGDIARIDDDGFVTITDRLSRFSKIGGEMVPHIKIEDKLHGLAKATDQTFAVTGISDARRGEKLVVLHTLDKAQLKDCLEKLQEDRELPNLWKPKAGSFHYLEALPYLGTGKLDLKKIRQLAEELES